MASILALKVEIPATMSSSKSDKLSTSSFPSTVKFFLKVEFSLAVTVSIKTPPLNVDMPRTSNNCVGCVLPIPTLLLLKSK